MRLRFLLRNIRVKTRKNANSQEDVGHLRNIHSIDINTAHNWFREYNGCLTLPRAGDAHSGRHRRFRFTTGKIVFPFQTICYSMIAKQSFALFVNYIWNSNVWNWRTAASSGGQLGERYSFCLNYESVHSHHLLPKRIVHIYSQFMDEGARCLSFVPCQPFTFVNSFIILTDIFSLVFTPFLPLYRVSFSAHLLHKTIVTHKWVYRFGK